MRPAVIGLSVFLVLIAWASLVPRLAPHSTMIRTVPRIHSYLATDEPALFSVDFLISDPDGLPAMEDAYETLWIEGDETFALDLVSLDARGTTVIDKVTMHQFVLRMAPRFHTVPFAVQIDEAALHARLVDGREMVFPMGAFSYRTHTSHEGPLRLEHLHNLYGSFGEGVTSQGMLLGLHNESGETLHIDSVSLGSERVSVHTPLITRNATPFEQGMDISKLVDERNVHTPLLEGNETMQFAIRFDFTTDLNLLYRYPLMIEYSVGEASYAFVLEDFMFINANPYAMENAPLFKEVTIHAPASD